MNKTCDIFNLQQVSLNELITHDEQKVLEILAKYCEVIFLVGGTPRDSFLFGKKVLSPKDLDFEIVLKKSWIWNDNFTPELISHDLNLINAKPYIEVLPYSVWRIHFELDAKLKSIEVARPRREIIETPGTHHYFRVEYFDEIAEFENKSNSTEFRFEISKRRDFTVNALLVELLFDHAGKFTDKGILHDPHQAISHFDEKSLCPVSDHFPADPIRFLRALRFFRLFQKQGHWTMSGLLKHYLKCMNLNHITWHYMISEWSKANDISFFDDFLSFLDLYSSIENYPNFMNALNFLKRYPLEKSLTKEIHEFYQQEKIINHEGYFNCNPDFTLENFSILFIKCELSLRIALNRTPEDFEFQDNELLRHIQGVGKNDWKNFQFLMEQCFKASTLWKKFRELCQMIYENSNFQILGVKLDHFYQNDLKVIKRIADLYREEKSLIDFIWRVQVLTHDKKWFVDNEIVGVFLFQQWMKFDYQNPHQQNNKKLIDEERALLPKNLYGQYFIIKSLQNFTQSSSFQKSSY